MNSASFMRVTAALLCLAIVSGCGGGGEGDAGRVDVYEVTGKVTMSGGPVADASVTFSPKEQQPVAVGRTNAAGEFTLTTYDGGDGAAAGEYVVLVSKEEVDKSSTGPSTAHSATGDFQAPQQHGGRAATQFKSLLPKKYGSVAESDLTATVKADGENNFTLELKP